GVAIERSSVADTVFDDNEATGGTGGDAGPGGAGGPAGQSVGTTPPPLASTGGEGGMGGKGGTALGGGPALDVGRLTCFAGRVTSNTITGGSGGSGGVGGAPGAGAFGHVGISGTGGTGGEASGAGLGFGSGAHSLQLVVPTIENNIAQGGAGGLAG